MFDHVILGDGGCADTKLVIRKWGEGWDAWVVRPTGAPLPAPGFVRATFTLPAHVQLSPKNSTANDYFWVEHRPIAVGGRERWTLHAGNWSAAGAPVEIWVHGATFGVGTNKALGMLETTDLLFDLRDARTHVHLQDWAALPAEASVKAWDSRC